MRCTITTLELIAGLNNIEGHQKEACIYTLDEPVEFFRIRFETPTDHTFQIEICDDKFAQVGVLEFDKEQAYMLHSWLTVLLGLNGYPKNIEEK